MRRSRKIVLAGVAVVLGGMALKVALTPVPTLKLHGHAIHGAYHVHSTKSDGRGSPDHIARAAARDGLDFVILSDHNVLAPALLGMHDGVLVIPATEESTPFGHVISLGAKRALAWKEKKVAPLAAIRGADGVPMLAHPLNRRRPWTDWGEIGQARGYETLSYDDLWRNALHAPWSNGLIVGALELPFNRALAVTQILRRPDDELAKFDALRQSQPLVQLCSVDAHGIPDYRSVLGMMSMYLDDVTVIHGPEDAPNVLASLESGHAFCAVDAFASGAGFSFHATAEGRTTLDEGDEGAAGGRILAVTLPYGAKSLPAWVHFFRDGKELLKAPGALQLAAPGPGDYRVEVWTKLPGAFYRGPKVPWILSNPIRLR